jgi:hypothetical protein
MESTESATLLGASELVLFTGFRGCVRTPKFPRRQLVGLLSRLRSNTGFTDHRVRCGRLPDQARVYPSKSGSSTHRRFGGEVCLFLSISSGDRKTVPRRLNRPPPVLALGSTATGAVCRFCSRHESAVLYREDPLCPPPLSCQIPKRIKKYRILQIAEPAAENLVFLKGTVLQSLRENPAYKLGAEGVGVPVGWSAIRQ